MISRHHRKVDCCHLLHDIAQRCGRADVDLRQLVLGEHVRQQKHQIRAGDPVRNVSHQKGDAMAFTDQPAHEP
ncbi:hypothetical protein D3C80_1838960 [compost metagenome]